MSAHNAELIDSRVGRILELLMTRQHVGPHRPIRLALANLAELPLTDAALRRRGIDPQKSIGRLRRTELVLLARSLAQLTDQAGAEIPVISDEHFKADTLVS